MTRMKVTYKQPLLVLISPLPVLLVGLLKNLCQCHLHNLYPHHRLRRKASQEDGPWLYFLLLYCLSLRHPPM